jgi:hypothetical protein
MPQPHLPLTADDLVHLCTARLDNIIEEFAFAKKETLLSFAVDLAMRYGASTEVHDELIKRVLEEIPTGGVHYALRLAPRAGVKTQVRLLGVMLAPFQYHNVDRTISYAREVLLRELSLQEVEKMAKWFQSCSNDYEKKERERLLEYIAQVHPKHLEKFKKEFQEKQAFWDGPGSIL